MNGKLVFATIPIGNLKLELSQTQDGDLWFLRTQDNQTLETYKVHEDRIICFNEQVSEHDQEVNQVLIEHYKNQCLNTVRSAERSSSRS